MELQARFHGVGMSAVGCLRRMCSGGASATADVQTLGRRYGARPTRVETHDLRDVDDHIDADAVAAAWGRGHELSKPRVMVISWSAERIGPRIIAAPQRGHAHVATVGVSVAVDGVAMVVRIEAHQLA